MNLENFDKEVNSLREEDSILADAILGLKSRREQNQEEVLVADENALPPVDEDIGINTNDGTYHKEDVYDQESPPQNEDAEVNSTVKDNISDDENLQDHTITLANVEEDAMESARENGVQLSFLDTEPISEAPNYEANESTEEDNENSQNGDSFDVEQLDFFSTETVFVAQLENELAYDGALLADEGADEKNDQAEIAQQNENTDEPQVYIPPVDTEEEVIDEVPPKAKKSKPAEKTRAIDTLFDFIEMFIFSLAAVLIITTFFFRHSVVEGGSMERTLFEGEHLIISDTFYTPERGDIIVFEDYTTALKKPVVKRIIALPGDTVEVTYFGEVIVNGEKLDEDYVYREFLEFHPVPKMTVPEGEVFVMGDHRNNSTDSRDIGTIKIDSILGKVLIRFYPFDKFGKVE